MSGSDSTCKIDDTRVKSNDPDAAQEIKPDSDNELMFSYTVKWMPSDVRTFSKREK